MIFSSAATVVIDAKDMPFAKASSNEPKPEPFTQQQQQRKNKEMDAARAHQATQQQLQQ